MTRLGGFGDDQPERAGEDAGSLALEIADAVESLSHLWMQAAQNASLRLSLHQLRALKVMEAAPGLNLTGLAASMDIGLPTASRLCDRLEAAGLLERVLHPSRRREVRLNLTRHGRHLLDEIAALRARALVAALAAMGAGERAALSRGLRAFAVAREDARAAPRRRPTS
ncbi:MarR family transcriptional regulator [Actinacidiphila sp. DG2A-62]|uniref:MarR family winged helix-turn-helix transcriptional regulator n=1 Tax=Actinacidiphila sp. DG2A-62 TaxID=3108821 RepID=UPI002DBD73AA|nr:MarR family transcriptional regulator [Actinacidiphila sp. DG2A-62]MEC3993731.1 MarR family transcriptional regulator [Actinacidiphila sp. DG2A-62]